MQDVLRGLASRQTVRRRVALVVAHPDDETIAAGGSLRLLPDLLLVHVTDGAPRTLADATAAGFDTPGAYAAARRAELMGALRIAGGSPELVELGVVDQDASFDMAGIARRLGSLFRAHGTEAVITHAYEGGHPDHDATAFAVHAASGQRPVLEFAGYHADAAGALVTGRFLPGPEPLVVTLTDAERARKRAMLDCFATQAAILGAFDAGTESFRAAPAYDFTAPPVAGRLNYEWWGWAMTGARWRELAREALCAA
jgi:LmbE family N-acetylglucosaminyl deacetylase